MKQFDVLILMYPGTSDDTVTVCNHESREHAQELLDKVALAILNKSALTIGGTTILGGAYIIAAKRRVA